MAPDLAHKHPELDSSWLTIIIFFLFFIFFIVWIIGHLVRAGAPKLPDISPWQSQCQWTALNEYNAGRTSDIYDRNLQNTFKWGIGLISWEQYKKERNRVVAQIKAAWITPNSLLSLPFQYVCSQYFHVSQSLFLLFICIHTSTHMYEHTHAYIFTYLFLCLF